MLELKVVKHPDSLDGVFEVRRLVFAEEQGIDPALDFDGLDEKATHVLALLDGKPVGTARVRFLDDRTAKIERVAVLSNLRGMRIGQQIMEKIEAYLVENKIERAIMDAQSHAQGFYERLGYIPEGEIFEEAGIDHIKMYKKLGEVA